MKPFSKIRISPFRRADVLEHARLRIIQPLQTGGKRRFVGGAAVVLGIAVAGMLVPGPVRANGIQTA